MWSERNQSGHRNDGIIFTLNTAPVEIGTSNSILKWKPAHSIDIRVTFKDECWSIFANCNKSAGFVKLEMTQDGRRFELQHGRLLEAIKPRQPCILECVISLDDNRVLLTPERERTDKTTPNTIHTIEATVRNTIENISSEDLISLVGSW